MKWDEIDKKLTGLADEIHDSYFLKDFIYRKGEFVVPAENNGDSDFGDWQPLDFEVLHRNQGIIWLRTVYTVPEQMMGVPLQGTQLRVNADYFPYFAPTEIYVNRTLRLKENAWMDFNCPEVILSQQAQPGEQFEILLRFDMRDKSFWNIDFRFCIIPESLEEMEFQLRSIVEELNYLQGLPCAQSYLPAAYELLEDCTFPALMHAIEQCRQLFLPVESEIKKRTVYLVGHAHIDMNWFWPMEETRAIVGRDFDTMTRLMEENPEFKFSQSQCATYQMAQEYYPDVFERMKEFVQKGQWDITASTWVENDMNMSDGESIARHMLYSKQYIQKHFGVSPKIMWCPDTFGHSANTPQMLNRAGIRYYFQTRCGIGVNDTPFENKTYTRDAHHVPIYWWRGMDGSKVLSINNIYTQDITTRGIVKLAARMADGFGIDKSMFVYGTGDHGGGPTRRDLKKIQLLKFSDHAQLEVLHHGRILHHDRRGIRRHPACA